MGLKVITNKIAAHKVFIKIADRFIKKPSVKINFDAITKLVFEDIGVNRDLKFVTGLINFQTGQIHLVDSCSHETLAGKKGLLKDIKTLVDGWYGFNLYCSELQSGLMEVSPKSGQFGGIPIEHSPVFENHMKDLFGNKADKFLSHQMKYARGFTDGTQRFWVRILDSKNRLLVPKSLSNRELGKWLTKSQLTKDS